MDAGCGSFLCGEPRSHQRREKEGGHPRLDELHHHTKCGEEDEETCTSVALVVVNVLVVCELRSVRFTFSARSSVQRVSASGAPYVKLKRRFVRRLKLLLSIFWCGEEKTNPEDC